MKSQPAIHVVAAVVVNRRGEVLLSRRPRDVHLAGLWEFPGGKVEREETAERALKREILEELGIDLIDVRPLIRVPHDYPERSVILDVWRVKTYRGTATGIEGQELAWVHPARLCEYQMPAADRPVVTAIALPDRYLITPEPDDEWSPFLSRLQSALVNGIRLVQLRAKRLTEAAYCDLAREVLAMCRDRGAELLLNQSARVVEELQADGIHLTGKRLWECNERPLPGEFRVGVSCHTFMDLQRAAQIDADFAVLGPVKSTASHPSITPLGWQSFRECANAIAFPVYALGGMQEADIAMSQANGGQGIAAIRALWNGAGRLTKR